VRAWLWVALVAGLCGWPAVGVETAVDFNQVSVEQLDAFLTEMSGGELTSQMPAPSTSVPRIDPALVSRERLPVACPAASDRPMPAATPEDYLRFLAQRNALAAESQAAVESPSMTLLGTLDGGATSGLIEINSDITTNAIWTAGNTYHVTANVNVQALLVIEPGTVVTFGSGYRLKVNSGGTIVARGTPGNPIVFTSDAATPAWGDYYCAVLIESTASVACEVCFCVVEFAYVGLGTEDIHLDEPLHDNFIYHSYIGIWQTGADVTDVLNNQIIDSAAAGIFVDMNSFSGPASPDARMAIRHNTIDLAEWDGILIFGALDPQEAGTVEMTSNLISRTMCGIDLLDGYVIPIVVCTGYYANTQNSNFVLIPGFVEDYPQEVFESPYDPGLGPLEGYYLDRYSPLVDTGWGTIGLAEPQLTGSATSADREPDTGTIDIGFHYSNFDLANVGTATYLEADINRDGQVGVGDLGILATQYGQTTSPGYNYLEADIDRDGEVGVGDLGILATQYGQSGLTRPTIAATVDGDPNDLSGWCLASTSGDTSGEAYVQVFLDGRFIGKVHPSYGSPSLEVETSTEANGSHALKLVGVDPNSVVTLSATLPVWFDNDLHLLTTSDNFIAGRDHPLAAMYGGSEDLTVSVFDTAGTVQWTVTLTTGGSLCVSIPDTALVDQINQCVVEEDAGASRVLCAHTLGQWVDPNDASTSTADALIFLPSSRRNHLAWDRIVQVIDACTNESLDYAVLAGRSCTWDNLAHWLVDPPDVHFLYGMGRAGGAPTASGFRSTMELYDGGEVFSYLRRDFSSVPAWYEDLSPVFEQDSQLSIGSLGLMDSGRFKIAFLDTCEVGASDDMAMALGMYSSASQLELDQVCLGWDVPVPMVGGDADDFQTYVQRFFSTDWNGLCGGLGNPNASVYSALCFAPDFTGGSLIGQHIQAWGYAQEATPLVPSTRWGQGLTAIYWWIFW